jgi:hypothetical protein
MHDRAIAVILKNSNHSKGSLSDLEHSTFNGERSNSKNLRVSA